MTFRNPWRRLLPVLPFLAACLSRADEPRRVLIVHSFGREFAPHGDLAGRFRVELARKHPQRIEFLETSLEMAIFDGEHRGAPLLEFLRASHAGRAPDILVAVGAQALLFCRRHREDLFPGVPILVLGAEKRRVDALAAASGPAGVVSIGFDVRLRDFIDNILEVLPRTRQVYVVNGTSPLEQFWQSELAREWPAAFEGRVTFHWLQDQSMDQVVATVRHLPPDSAVFLAFMMRDAADVPFEGDSGIALLRAAANAPLFGTEDLKLGDGIVGGPLVPIKKVAVAGADAAASLLRGTPVSAVASSHLPLDPPAYDLRELKRWNIPERALPRGSAVVFRPPGLWQTHRAGLLIGLGVLVLQTGLILLLVAERRRSRATRDNLALAAEAATIGLWHLDLAAEDIIASPRWRAVFDLPETGRISFDEVLERLHHEDRFGVRTAIEQALGEGRSFSLEHRVVRRDGAVRWVASHGRAGTGGDRGMRGASRDITERRQALMEANQQRAELAHLSRVSSLGVLSGALAHELNQPLGTILSNAQAARHLLARDEPDLAEIREIIDDIISEDRRASEVIRRLRSLLRRGEVALQPLGVNETIGEVLALAQSDLIERGIEVTCRFSDDLPLAVSDRVQLQQVLINMVSNACDAMVGNLPGDRGLTLATFLDGAEVRIDVLDLGPGLSGDAEDLFKPFRTSKPDGLGMGLAISRALVTAHGGRLWAGSNGDRGAAFHIALPVAPEPA